MDISVIREKTRFSPEAPVQEVIYDAHGKRCILFCLEPGQSAGLSPSSGAVSLFVIDGEGSFVGEDEEQSVGKGVLALCDKEETDTTSLRATSRFVVLVVIT
jgi:quercetin dioxygenase-like cupin family protein